MHQPDPPDNEATGTCDARTLSALQLNAGLTEAQLDDLIAWQRRAARPGESLVDLLRRYDIIGESSAAQLAKLGSMLDIEQGSWGLDPQERQRLSELARVHGPSPAPAATPPTAAPRDEALPHVGDRLGKCILTHELGRGATSRVFSALHATLNVTVAVKVFTGFAARCDDAAFQLFRHEARTLAVLNNPHIVRVLDFDETPVPYIIMEFVDGMSAQNLLDATGAITPNQATRILLQVAKGLSYAHRHRVIHRDLKPANILLDKEGHVKLADLGLSYIAAAGDCRAGADADGLLCGTPAYIAPEVAFDPGSAGVRSDIYSLGATIYHLVTGRYPFEAPSVRAMILKHAHEPVRSPHELCPAMNPGLSLAIRRMMAKRPEDRFQDMDEVVLLADQMLRLADSPGSAHNPTITTVIRRRLVRLLLGDQQGD